jgi:protein involved in polysaccharide export with SLBB domain
MRISLLRTLTLTAALALAAVPSSAQPGPELPRREPTRGELEALLARSDQAARAPELSDEARTRAVAEAGLIRARLRDGDLQPGDQVALEVEGEQALTASFVVTPRRELVLPGMDPVSLSGVLRTELEDRLRAHVGRFLRHPVVRARAMMRVAVLGQVRTPGFYAVPAESMVSDAIMAAGGPLPTGRLESARISRGGARIWAGRGLQEAVQHGLTLDQMSLRSGDEIFIPQDPGSRTSVALRLATALPAAVLAVVGISRLF